MPQGLLFQSFHDITNIKWSRCFIVSSGVDLLFMNVHQVFVFFPKIWFGHCIIQPAPNSHWTFLNSWKMFIANPDCSVQVWSLRLITARWLFFSSCVIVDFFHCCIRAVGHHLTWHFRHRPERASRHAANFGNGSLKERFQHFGEENDWLSKM